jgi:hypothetical protein
MTFVVLGTPGAEERDRSPASKLADISRPVVRSKASTQHTVAETTQSAAIAGNHSAWLRFNRGKARSPRLRFATNNL